jgi:predicted nucleotide-binding protein
VPGLSHSPGRAGPQARATLIAEQIRRAKQLLARLERLCRGKRKPVAERLGVADVPEGRVWVVHGRDEAIKEKVARFLLKLGLEPIILDEEAARGRTLIEKLEGQAPLAFAVVLLTGDDIGGLASDPARRPRARQNVIFELGFSIAKLGRGRVCVLYEEGVELPSDFRGVEYKPLDAAGAWRWRLARELLEAGLRFDPIRAL